MSVGQSTLSLQATAMDNRGGRVQALDDATVDIGDDALDNSASLLCAGGTLTLRAAQVVNAKTQDTDQDWKARRSLLAALIDNRRGAARRPVAHHHRDLPGRKPVRRGLVNRHAAGA